MQQRLRSAISTFSATSVLCLLVLGTPLNVQAQAQAQMPAQGAGQAFSINPPLLDLKADPGQTLHEQIQFTNISADTLLITAQANDFGAKDEEGTPNILLNNPEKSPTSLRDWLQLPTPQAIKNGETKKIDFSIVVPQNAEPGGHYGVIRFGGSSSSTNGSGVALSASLGTLILLRVSGNVQERGSLSSFYSATPNQFTAKSFFERGPVGFVVRVSNDGNVHFAPTGTLIVKNIFGKKIATIRVNGTPGDRRNPPKNVLSASVRRFQTTLDKKGLFGHYTAQLDLVYGESGKHLIASVSFWVLPYKLIAGVAVGLVVLAIFFGVGLKKYNAYIVKKAKLGGGPPG